MNDDDFNEFIKDRVKDWCAGYTVLPKLHEYLRMSRKEYYLWLTFSTLPFGIKSRWGFKEE